jgi:transposase-like protein
MKCNDCSRTFTIKGLNVGGNPYSQEKRQRVLDLLKAGLSFRKIAKKENIDIKTISIWHFMHEMGR